MPTSSEVLTRAQDKFTDALKIVDYSHYEIHGGSHFYISGYTTLDTDGVLQVSLVTLFRKG